MDGVDVDDEDLPLRLFRLLGHIGKLLDGGGGGGGGAIQIGLVLLDGHFLHLFHFLFARLLNGLLLDIGHFDCGSFCCLIGFSRFHLCLRWSSLVLRNKRESISVR